MSTARKMQLDQADAQIEKTQAIIAQKDIKAPFSGRLGVRQIDLGQYLNPGAPIVTLTDLSTLYVNFTLPSQMTPQIAVGQKVDVTADAFPGRKFAATVSTIEPQISASTRTINIQATMANPDEALLPGMFINAAVVLPTDASEVVVPETAVDYTLYGDSVYVIRPRVHRRQWQTGTEGGTAHRSRPVALGRQGRRARRAERGRRGHRRRADQGSGRLGGRRHRKPAAATAGTADTAVI